MHKKLQSLLFHTDVELVNGTNLFLTVVQLFRFYIFIDNIEVLIIG